MESKVRKSSEPVYTLGIISRLSGIPGHTIRQYVDKSLIIPFTTSKKRHIFSEVDLSRLRCIRNMMDTNGLNVAGIKSVFSLIPCWLIRQCAIEDRTACEAFNSPGLPCWEASKKGPNCRNNDCRLCDVYRLPGECQDYKTLVKRFLSE